jgi:Xaa-Pro aminopeptidase
MGSGPIQKGASIVIDIYPRSKTTGYFADMSRTVCIGPASPELRKMYAAVLEAQTLGISMVKLGAHCGDIHAAVAHVFSDAGYLTSGKGREFPFAEGFVHGLGHGVGLEIHEAPRISRNSTDVLEEGDVITIEPGLYYKGIGGIRLEDMLLVTAQGAENLTNFPKIFEI